MNILNKKYERFERYKLYSIGRVLIYIVAILMIIGIQAYMTGTTSEYINYGITISLFVIVVGVEFFILLRKYNGYKSHYLIVLENEIEISDHRGVFRFNYEDIDSYLVAGDTLTIRVNKVPFTLKTMSYGVSQDDLREIIDHITSKEVQVYRPQMFMVSALIVILVLNFGLDYVFNVLLNMNELNTLFATLYTIFLLGTFIFGYVRFTIMKLRNSGDLNE